MSVNFSLNEQDDSDSWFSTGADETHQRYLDEMGYVNDDSDADADVAEDVQ